MNSGIYLLPWGFIFNSSHHVGNVLLNVITNIFDLLFHLLFYFRTIFFG